MIIAQEMINASRIYHKAINVAVIIAQREIAREHLRNTVLTRPLVRIQTCEGSNVRETHGCKHGFSAPKA